MTNWEMYRCDECRQLCLSLIDVTVQLTGRKKVLLMCHDCFESAVRRSDGQIVTSIDGTLDVILAPW